MKSFNTKKLVLMGLFLALGIVLPFFTGQIPSLGSKLLPMHIPVLLTGFLCGAPYGLIVGFIVPLFRSVLFGMPPMFPTATAMAFELAAYGFFAGIFYQVLPKKKIYLYISLLLSMILGRVVWGLVSVILYGISGGSFTWKVFISGAVLNAIPGIVIQIVIIPIILMVLIRNGVKDEY